MRFMQLYNRGWDQHNDLPRDLALQCKSVDQPSAALVTDLKQRGLLDDTLVVWGGEFGRTVYCQGKLTDSELRPRSSSALLHHVDGRRRHQAGLHVAARPTISATTSSPTRSTCTTCRPRSCTAWASITSKLTYKFQGRHFRLTDVAGNVVPQILA